MEQSLRTVTKIQGPVSGGEWIKFKLDFKHFDGISEKTLRSFAFLRH